MSTATTRPISSADDRAACGKVFVDSFVELHGRQGLHDTSDPEGDSAFIADALEHFVATDPGLQWLAEDDDGGVIAFVSAWRRDAFWFLAFLFVHPEAQASGVGRGLLERVLPPEIEREDLTLATMIESTQPVSQALYARYGMVPRSPRARLRGVPIAGVLPDGLPDDVAASLLADVDPDELEAFERIHLGYSRRPDHAYFRGRGDGGVSFGYRRRGMLCGFGYATTDPEWGLMIHPAVADRGELLPAIVSHLAAQGEGGMISTTVNGGADGLLPLLLRAGLRIASFQEEEHFPFLYCATAPGADPDRILPFAGFLL